MSDLNERPSADTVWQIEDNDPENDTGPELVYDFAAPDPED